MSYENYLMCSENVNKPQYMDFYKRKSTCMFSINLSYYFTLANCQSLLN